MRQLILTVFASSLVAQSAPRSAANDAVEFVVPSVREADHYGRSRRPPARAS